MTEAPTKTGIHDKLVHIMKAYLGPAGERFLDRQIEFHLNKKPRDIELEDVDQLKEWVKVSLALLTEDKPLVDRCIAEIETLKG
jgi:hypothetical protein